MNNEVARILGEDVIARLHNPLSLSECLDVVKLAHYTSDKRQVSMVWVPHESGGVKMSVIEREGDQWSFLALRGCFGVQQERTWLFVTPQSVAAWVACAWQVGIEAAPKLWTKTS